MTLDSDKGEISDGFHTFNELYDHRITLFIALMRHYTGPTNDNGRPSAWKSRLHNDGTSFDGWFVAGIGKTSGDQITYHLPLDRWDECNVPEMEHAPKWDGHTSDDVLKRLKRL